MKPKDPQGWVGVTVACGVWTRQWSVDFPLLHWEHFVSCVGAWWSLLELHWMTRQQCQIRWSLWHVFRVWGYLSSASLDQSLSWSFSPSHRSTSFRPLGDKFSQNYSTHRQPLCTHTSTHTDIEIIQITEGHTNTASYFTDLSTSIPDAVIISCN